MLIDNFGFESVVSSSGTFFSTESVPQPKKGCRSWIKLWRVLILRAKSDFLMETREVPFMQDFNICLFLLHHMVKKNRWILWHLTSFAFAICLCFIWYSLQRRSKDHCLKKFENCFVIIPSLSVEN